MVPPSSTPGLREALRPGHPCRDLPLISRNRRTLMSGGPSRFGGDEVGSVCVIGISTMIANDFLYHSIIADKTSLARNIRDDLD